MKRRVSYCVRNGDDNTYNDEFALSCFRLTRQGRKKKNEKKEENKEKGGKERKVGRRDLMDNNRTQN